MPFKFSIRLVNIKSSPMCHDQVRTLCVAPGVPQSQGPRHRSKNEVSSQDARSAPDARAAAPVAQDMIINRKTC